MSPSHSFQIIDVLLTVLDEEHAHAVVEHRRSNKPALTLYSAKLLAKQFARCVDPNEAADEMILRGWRGFKPEWVRDRDLTKPMRVQASGNALIDALARRPH